MTWVLVKNLIEKIFLVVITTFLTITITGSFDRSKEKEVLDIKFNLLIKEIEDLLEYMENIIIYDSIKESYYITGINYNEILVDYIKIYKDKNNQTIETVNNLLCFYIKRKKVENEIIKQSKLIFSLDHSSKKELLKSSYIRFIKEVYCEFEEIFIDYKLENQIRLWQEKSNFKLDFKFKRMEQLDNIRDEYLNGKLKCLEKEYIEIKTEVIRLIGENRVNEFINNEYYSIKNEEYYIEEMEKNKYGIQNEDDAISMLKDKIKVICEIRSYLGIL